MKKIDYTYFDKIKNSLPNISEYLTYDKIRELRKITNDPHIWSCMQSRKSGLLAHNFNLINDNNILNKIDINNLINSALDSLFYGFQAFEIVWEWDKQYIPKEIIPLPQEIFNYDIFNKNINNIKINMNGKYEEINDNKIIICYNNKSINNPLGISLLEKIWWSAKFKNIALQYWIDYLERFGMPLILGKMHRASADTEINTLLENLKNMAGNNILLAPKDLDLEYKEALRQESVDMFMNLIETTNNEISKTILSQTLTTEIKQGSLAAAQTHLTIRKEIIESDARLINSFINKIIKLTDSINNTNSNMKFEYILNDEDKKERLERDIALSKIGVKFTKEYWQNAYQYSEDDII